MYQKVAVDALFSIVLFSWLLCVSIKYSRLEIIQTTQCFSHIFIQCKYYYVMLTGQVYLYFNNRGNVQL